MCQLIPEVATAYSTCCYFKCDTSISLMLSTYGYAKFKEILSRLSDILPTSTPKSVGIQCVAPTG